MTEVPERNLWRLQALEKPFVTVRLRLLMLYDAVTSPQPFFSGILPLQAVTAYCVQEKGELWRESEAGEGSGQGVSEGPG